MFKKDISFNYITSKAIVIYLHGYKGDKNEFSFVKDFIIKNKRLSFLSFSYKLKDLKNKTYMIKEIILNIRKIISPFFDTYHFDKCYLIGNSLGAALAVEIASKNLIKCDKLILISIFDDRKDLLKCKGISVLNNRNLSPIKAIKKIKKTPIIFIHGSLDKSVGLERAMRVFSKSGKNSKFIILPVDHYFKDAHSKKLLIESLDGLLNN